MAHCRLRSLTRGRKRWHVALLALQPLVQYFSVGYLSCRDDGVHLYCPQNVGPWKICMMRQIMYCEVLFWSPIRRHTVAYQFSQTFSKIPLSTFSLYTLSHLRALFRSASAYSVGDVFHGWVTCILLAPGSAILSSAPYILSKYLIASQYDVILPSL